MDSNAVKLLRPKPKSGGSLFVLRDILKCEFKEYDFQFLYGSYDFAWKKPEGKITRVLLAGDGLMHLSNPWLWPRDRKIQLWALSRSHRKLFAGFLNCPDDHVGFIDLRVPQNKMFIPRQLDELTHLIIASRIVPNKKWRASLNLGLALKKKFPGIKTIFFCSNRPQGINPEDRSFLEKAAQNGVHVDLECGRDWHKRAPKERTGMIHLSLDMHEDFGVSVWQACQIGFQPILSRWGSHPDFGRYSPYFVAIEDILKLEKAPYLPKFISSRECDFPKMVETPKTISTELIYAKAKLVSPSAQKNLFKFYSTEFDFTRIPHSKKWILNIMAQRNK